MQLNFGAAQIVGCLLMMLMAGVSSLVGLGGGGVQIIILILLFNIIPKNATIVVFACIFGGSFGNMVNQTRRMLNDEAVVNYLFTTITIPLMFIGALVGVMMNQLLPSVVTVAMIIAVNVYKLPQIMERFIKEYRKQTQVMGEQLQFGEEEIIKETKVNPFSIISNLRIYEQLLILILLYILLSFLKGTKTFSSIIGIQICSFPYWTIQAIIVLIALAFFQNSLILFRNSRSEGGQGGVIESNKGTLIRNSLAAGVISGLGLGGGVLLVPLYRQLKLSPIQASSTGAFTVFITSGINVVQALFLGYLGILQFLLYFSVTGMGSYLISLLVSGWLRRNNRNSIVQLFLFILTIVMSICLPLSLWLKMQQSGGNWSLILGLGSIC